jgi:hypothetical protein
VDFVRTVIANELPESVWTGMLPQLLDTASIRSVYFSCYKAAQEKLGDKGFLSRDITVTDLLLNSGDVHPIYPRNYMKRMGVPSAMYNQIANYAITQSEINIAIGDRVPEAYFAELAGQCRGGEVRYGGFVDLVDPQANLRMNCIPESMADRKIMDFTEFLGERRKLIALKIKR